MTTINGFLWHVIQYEYVNMGIPYLGKTVFILRQGPGLADGELLSLASTVAVMGRKLWGQVHLELSQPVGQLWK